jgi:hypothetical protein
VDRIKPIVFWQWRAFWRRVSNARNLNAGNQAVLLIFSVLAAIRYIQALQHAAVTLAQGKSQSLGALLNVLFLIWMFPLITSARSYNSLQKLLHLPLTVKELLAVRVALLLMSPYAWIIVAASAAICYPITYAANPPAGILAAVLFIVFAFFVGLTISQLLRNRLWRILIFSVVLSLGATAIFMIQSQGRDGLLWISSRGPNSLVTSAALGVRPWFALIELALLALFASLAAYWSFRHSLQATPPRRSQRIFLFNPLRIRGPVGVLSAKDLRYFRRLLDPYLGILVCVLGGIYLGMADNVSAGLLQIWCLGVIVPSTSLAFNMFGLDDRAGMDRIRVMPLTGRSILSSKNVAFILIVGPQVLPLILLGSLRLGPALGAILLLETISTTAMFLAWGNWVSINHPFKMHSFEFSNSGGLVLETLAGLFIGGLPGVIAIYLVHVEGLKAIWKIAPMAVVSIAVSMVSVRYAAARWTDREDEILKAVS